MPPRRRRKHGTRFSWKPCRNNPMWKYLLDVLLFSDMEERAALIASYGKEVRNLERRMADFAARTAAGRRTGPYKNAPPPRSVEEVKAMLGKHRERRRAE